MKELTTEWVEKAESTQFNNQVVEALKNGLGDRLVAIVLYGSRARGDADQESDWDFLLIAHNLPTRILERHRFLKTLLPVTLRGKVSLVSKTTAEFDASLAALYLDIALDGEILYDKNGFATDRLTYLKRLIVSKGLIREKKGYDFFWRWEEFPGFDWSLEWEGSA